MRATVAEPQGRCREAEVEGSGRQSLDCRNTNGQRGLTRAASRLGTAKPNAYQGAPGRARQHEGTDAVLTWGDLGSESRREVSGGHSTLRALGSKANSEEGLKSRGNGYRSNGYRKSPESLRGTKWDPEWQEPASSRLKGAAPGAKKRRSPCDPVGALPERTRLSEWPDCQNGQGGQQLNRRMRKTVRPVVWEGARAQSRVPDPISPGRGKILGEGAFWDSDECQTLTSASFYTRANSHW